MIVKVRGLSESGVVVATTSPVGITARHVILFKLWMSWT